MAITGVHVDGFDDRDISWIDVDEGVLDEVVHQLFEAHRCGVIKTESCTEVPRHLVQYLLAPVDLDGACVGGIKEVIAESPREQDVGVCQDDRDRQSTSPIWLENSASASAAFLRRA